MSASLRELARSRTDMFGTDQDEETRKLQEDEERAKRREKEKVIWDGHTSSKAATLDKFQHSSNLDDQIAAIHKAAGLNKYVQTRRMSFPCFCLLSADLRLFSCFGLAGSRALPDPPQPCPLRLDPPSLARPLLKFPPSPPSLHHPPSFLRCPLASSLRPRLVPRR